MSKFKISRKDSTPYGRQGVEGWNYPLPNIEDGSSWVYAELTGEHGERTTAGRSRVYYILEGSGEFIVSGHKFAIEPGDVIPVPPLTTYNYWPNKDRKLKVLLFMELLDTSKLPKK